MDGSMPGLPVHHQLPELTQTPVHWVSDAIQPSHPLLSASSPAFNLSQHQGLCKWVSSSYQMAKVLEFQLQHQYFQWILKTDFILGWTGWTFLQSKGLSSLLQHHSSKASILWCSAFFIVQLSHPYMTTGKTIALTRQTFFGKVMSLLFNMLSRLVIAFLGFIHIKLRSTRFPEKCSVPDRSFYISDLTGSSAGGRWQQDVQWGGWCMSLPSAVLAQLLMMSLLLSKFPQFGGWVIWSYT